MILFVQNRSDRSLEYYNVVFGEVDRFNPSSYHVNRTIINVIKHENNLALLKLSEPVEFNDYVHPACLATDMDELVAYGDCQIAGWGRLEGRQ